MKPNINNFSVEVGGKTLTFETGKIAQQAGGSVTLSFGESLLFCSATMSNNPREGINFFPLSVDFEEKLYAGGRIPGGFFRREGRPTENAILTARLTDRPLRPLFPKDMRNEVQVIIYALSSDGENLLDVHAINVASAAVAISNIPWNGPVAAVRIGQIEGEFVVNPTYEQLEKSDLDLRVAGTKEALLMVEAGANEVSEDVVVSALELAHKAMQPIIDAINEMREKVGKAKSEYKSIAIEKDLYEKVSELSKDQLVELFNNGGSYNKHDRDVKLNEIREEILAEFDAEDAALIKDVKEAFDKTFKETTRELILTTKNRPDGRKTTEVRPIWCEVDYSPRAHGSGIFTRGETQVLTVTTLGTPRDAQLLDNLTPNEKKRYMHHYNFPPFSVGETRFLRGASRREIGHGVLAERALLPVIPEDTEFPYTLRLVSECMSSNGSTSMGSVCGSTLSLMDAGVPIKAPVSGIAMGMISDDDSYVILTDIQGLEDHIGDMDFKVAGTTNGITALQMDIKLSGLTSQVMSEALQQAKEGRAHILEQMLSTLPAPRPEMKEHTPRITTIKISVEKIGAVIGKGGETIRRLQEETDTNIDIQDDGTVFIASANSENAKAALSQIEALTEEAELGRIYTGKVVRVTDFGAFVQIMPGTDGMVHISQLDSERIDKVEDVAVVGEEITVMVTAIGHDGKIRLSRKAVLEGWTVEEAVAQDNFKKRSGGRDNRSRNRRR
jgi:polyribonucleotide nucleotidyltransferase